MILLPLFLLLLALTQIRSDCLVNYNPKDIHSGSFVASSTSAADATINSTLSTFAYSLPNMFSSAPQVALTTSTIQSTLADGVYYSIVANPSTRQIAVGINVSSPSSWQSFKVQLMASNRSDIQLGSYATGLQSNQFQVTLTKEVKNPVAIPILSGFRINKFISSSAIPCYFKITSTKVSSRNLSFAVDTNCVNEVNINYIVYDAQSLKKQYKVTQNNIRLSTTKLDPTLIDFGSTNIMGLNGFMASFQSSFSFTSSFSSLLTITVGSTTIVDISFAYFIVQNLRSQYCKNCNSGYIISDNFCVNICPTSSITSSSQNLKLCTTCDITQFLIPNDYKTACVCAIQYYPSQNGTQCSPCDGSCLTCNGSRANNCLSCDPSTRVLSKGSCALKSGYTNSGNSESDTLSPSFTLTNPVPNPVPDTNLNSFPSPLTPSDIPIAPIICGKNQVLKKDQCVCTQGFFNVSGECVQCPSNRFFNGQSFSDCTNGVVSYDQMSCYCNSGYYLIDGKCQMCPENSSFDGNQCTCSSGLYKFQNTCLISCPANSTLNGKQCVCPPGLVPFVDKCAPCPADSVFFGSSCVCSNGNPFNLSSNSCSPNNKVSLTTTNMQILQDRVTASVQLSPFPSQLTSNPSLISNILNINLRSGIAPTVSVSYRPPDIVALQFSSRDGTISPFAVSATINPLFSSFFPNQDISTELQISI